MAKLGAPDSIEPFIRGTMGLPDASVDDFFAHHLGDDRIDRDLLRAIADANRRWERRPGLAMRTSSSAGFP
ncbi:hypothetical protein [Sphingomonas daechungensis]|uniref:hypothetical protein n=1 Tax=Sphingomonas daechungensis TaxID=1176646 RepID=UPI001CB9CEB6|nr:hypothetical protein [Sphingomonas daechungensis]